MHRKNETNRKDHSIIMGTLVSTQMVEFPVLSEQEWTRVWNAPGHVLRKDEWTFTVQDVGMHMLRVMQCSNGDETFLRTARVSKDVGVTV